MDIYEYLELDHDHVDKLFKQFEKSELPERRKQIVEFICQELLIHAHSEQETFYKALKRFESTNGDASHGQKEHKEIEDQINLILNSKEYGSPWAKKVEKLKEIVEHHVKEEETTIFGKAKKVLSKEEACMIKDQMHYLKQRLLLSLQKEMKSAKHTKKQTITKTKKAHRRQQIFKKEETRSRLH